MRSYQIRMETSYHVIRQQVMYVGRCSIFTSRPSKKILEAGNYSKQSISMCGLVANGTFPARELPRALGAQVTETVIAPNLRGVGPKPLPKALFP